MAMGCEIAELIHDNVVGNELIALDGDDVANYLRQGHTHLMKGIFLPV